MSLDEIIAAQKQHDKAGPRRVRTNIIRSVVYPIRAPREGFRWRGGNAHFSRFSKISLTCGKNFRPNRDGADGPARYGDRFRAGGNRGSDHEIVTVRVSNLATTVVTEDIDELFQKYDVLACSVNYDAGGNHLTTADARFTRANAKRILRDFAGITLDGKEIQLAMIDEKQLADRPYSNYRYQRVDGLHGVRNGGVKKHVLFVSGGRPHKNGHGGGAKYSQKSRRISVDDLDKDLDAYMTTRKT
ncbi:ALY-1 protein [Aphelenchoides avenae]|nr:ALY-1 protein [Aphelenchus avenae]